MKKIVAFSLWGDDPKYVDGAIKNAFLMPQVYPGWTARFYMPSDQLRTASGHTLLRVFTLMNYDEDFMNTGTKIEVIGMDEPGTWHGMFWRFLPASEEDVDVFISRDCDSRLSKREAAAVDQWLKSPYLVHSMADHPYHFHPRMGLMGGMFGMKKHACPQMEELIEQFKARYPNAWQCDQSFLRDYIFPLVSHKTFPTSDIHPGCNKFPLPREGGAFVGEIIGQSDNILHPEHRAIRDA